MKLKMAMTALLFASLGFAYGGTFTSMTLLSSTETKTSVAGGLASGTADVDASIPHGVITLITSATASVSAGHNGGSSASVLVTANYQVEWTQSYPGETPPATLYDHHSVTANASASTNLPGVGSIAATGQYSNGCNASDIYSGGFHSNTVTDSKTTTYTGSVTPSWTYVSTNGSGCQTFQSNPLTITSGTASSSVSVLFYQYHGLNTATASAACDANDNFYFDVV